MSWGVWIGVALGALVLLAALTGPLRRVGRLLLRWCVGLAVLWRL